MADSRLISADSHFVEPPTMWSSDYPHGQATFPHSQEYVTQHLSKVSETDRRKLVHDTAAKFYGLS